MKVDDPPAWFRAVVLGEIMFQVPFYFVAVYALVLKRNWFRIPGLIYGTHVTTTMIPIYGTLFWDPASFIAAPNRYLLPYIYFPYLLIPFLMMLYLAFVSQPFGPNNGKNVATTKKNK